MPARALTDSAVNVAGVPQAITVGASPFTYTNNSGQPELVIFNTSTTAATITVAKGGVVIATMTNTVGNFNALSIILGAGQSIVITYSAGAPTMVRDPV